ncbi:hypothetical protein MXEN_09624 [Mycobacterium xenopi RIVM700367]|nr:hypothetical protein MXEN_09624 [Mycobacterium xenopi RIVM700367]
MLEKLPRWRLDLDESVEFDAVDLTIADNRTGESFCLKAASRSGISFVAAEPPGVGRWYKVGLPPHSACGTTRQRPAHRWTGRSNSQNS